MADTADTPAGGARYREVEAKSVTRIPGFVDPWFLGRYGMNLYRGCEHGCLYCDGRAERYYVSGDFARDITVKRNAAALLARELGRVREPGFVLVGGGVCDAYQPAEARYRLARGALELALEHGLPVHVLTKAELVARDLELLERIEAGGGRAILSFSIQTTDDAVRQRFEPGAAPIGRRFALLAEAKARGLVTGVMAMPVLPGISDQAESIDTLLARAADVGVDFVLCGGLTLRPGAQQDLFFAAIAEHHPEHLAGYRRIFREGRASGQADRRYYARVDSRFAAALAHHRLPGRIPRRVFTGQIPRYAEAAVLLEHEEHRRRARGEPGRGLGRAGMAIQKWARTQFAAHRSRSFGWQQLERAFDALRQGDAPSREIGLSRLALELVDGWLG